MTLPSPRPASSPVSERMVRRVLLLDGAIGVMIQRMRLDEAAVRGRRFVTHPRPLAANLDILSLSRPDIVASIHRAYLDAGADIIETNTFNATAIAQQPYGTAHLVRDINIAAARTARREADRYTAADPSHPRYVAGSVGPTAVAGPLTASSPMCDTLADAYAEQCEALIAGGVDLLLIETVYNLHGALAAARGAQRAMAAEGRHVPLIFSMTAADETGRIYSGHTPEVFTAALTPFKPLAVGFNCSAGPDSLTAAIRRLRTVSPAPIIYYPNAGLPDAAGTYHVTPDAFACSAASLIKEIQAAPPDSDRGGMPDGVPGFTAIIGGCCGTTPAHIAALRALIDASAARR